MTAVPHSILVLFAHPAYQKSRANRHLVELISDIESITFHDLYEAYPDYHVDVRREQQLLVDHDIIVFQHPLYWYSSPALLKEWMDLVLEHGFAYGDTSALQGKRLFTAITTGGGADAYTKEGINRHTIHELLAPFRQTAQFCDMEYLPPFVVHGTLQNPDEGRFRQRAEDYREALIGLRDDTLSYGDLHAEAYMNDALPEKESNSHGR